MKLTFIEVSLKRPTNSSMHTHLSSKRNRKMSQLRISYYISQIAHYISHTHSTLHITHTCHAFPITHHTHIPYSTYLPHHILHKHYILP